MAITYKPQGLSVLILDSIPTLFLHPKTREITTPALIGRKFMCKFPSGQLYFESKLDLDTDGSAYISQDPSGQASTSAKDAGGKSLDADLINYFVLPGGFYPQHGIQFGDIGVVIYGIRMAYACFGDVGPSNKLGEGSIALHRDLGHEVIVGRHTASGGRLINAGISSGVITIVFPGSGNGHGVPNRESAAIGERLFQKLLKEAESIGDFPLPAARNIG
ncbi:MAG: glycoside hydrolase family 75 protein [Bryobacterales bacterium]|nr:glycoside hydrolase family 75 protein [Bryobacterales bacterium]